MRRDLIERINNFALGLRLGFLHRYFEIVNCVVYIHYAAEFRSTRGMLVSGVLLGEEDDARSCLGSDVHIGICRATTLMHFLPVFDVGPCASGDRFKHRTTAEKTR